MLYYELCSYLLYCHIIDRLLVSENSSSSISFHNHNNSHTPWAITQYSASALGQATTLYFWFSRSLHYLQGLYSNPCQWVVWWALFAQRKPFNSTKDSITSCISQSMSNPVSISCVYKVMLWHFHLGVFGILKRCLIICLAIKVPIPIIHTRDVYSSIQYVPLFPFHVIHNDIYRPSSKFGTCITTTCW